MRTPRPILAVIGLLVLTAMVLSSAGTGWAQRTDKRDMRRAVKYLEEDPEYLAKLPKVIWRRPMGPYVGDVLKGYYGGPGPAKLVCEKDGHRFKIAGGNFMLVWDDRRGGELSEIFLFDGGTWRHVNCTMAYLGRDTIPRYFIQRQKDFYGNSPAYYLNQAINTRFNVTRKTSDRVEFWTENRMCTTDRDPSPWTVRQNFRVYASGVVVCDFEVKLDGAETFGLRYARMGAYLEDVLFKEIYMMYPPHFRWGSAVYGSPVVSAPNWKKHNEDGMLPMGSASFGVSEFADFNNRFEFWLERPRPFVGRDLKVTRTNFHVFSSGLWYEPSDMSTRPSCGRAYEWELFKGDPTHITPPFAYRNRWVLAVGGPKVGNAPTTPVSRRNNLLAARIYHWANTADAGKAAWYPDDQTLTKMAAQGADVLVLSRGWSKAGAALQPADAGRLSAVVGKAHALKMRVILNIPFTSADRAASLFKDLLSPGRDGLMLEGLGSTTMKPDADRDAPAYDLASRVEALAALRKLVGDAGVLLGRAEAGLPTQIEMAFLDAVVPADDAAAGLVRSPDRLLTNDAVCGSALSPLVIGGDRRTAARVAGAPVSAQVTLGAGTPIDPAAAENRALAPLWKLLSRLDGPVIHALSPRLESNPNLQVVPRKTPVVAYLTGAKMLLVVSNPSGRTKCRITLGPELGVGPDAAGVLLVPGGTALKQTPVRLVKGVLEIPELPAGQLRAYEFPRTPP